MNHVLDTWPRNRASLARILILLLAGAFAGLVVDIRVEHVDAVREHSVAWMPIIYSAFMTIACSCAFVLWNTITRRIMLPLFLAAFVIGALGFYFHNEGNLVRVIRTSARAWTDPKMEHPESPPQFAPMAFAGLGAIGALASLNRFQDE